jgi:hypothetical protein
MQQTKIMSFYYVFVPHLSTDLSVETPCSLHLCWTKKQYVYVVLMFQTTNLLMLHLKFENV